MKVKCVAHLAYYMFAAVGVAAESTGDAMVLRLNALEESVSTLLGTVTKLRKDNKVLTEENKVLRRNFNRKITQLDKNLEFKAASIKFLSGDINIVRVDNNVLRDELKQLGKDLEVKAASIKFLDGDISIVKADNDVLRNGVKKLFKTPEVKATLGNATASSIKFVNVKLSRYRRSYMSKFYRDLLVTISSTSVDLRDGLERLGEDLEFKAASIKFLDGDINNVRADNNVLRDELKQLGEDLEVKAASISSLDGDISIVEVENNALHDQLNSMQSTLDECFILKAGKLVINCTVDFSREDPILLKAGE